MVLKVLLKKLPAQNFPCQRILSRLYDLKEEKADLVITIRQVKVLGEILGTHLSMLLVESFPIVGMPEHKGYYFALVVKEAFCLIK